MTVKELIKKLQKYPEDLKVWVSDNGYCEGATPFKEFKVEQAYKAGLDGDEVDNEYLYADDLNEDEFYDYEKKGYKLFPNKQFPVFSKQILMIYGK
jgi:hypothetical protein